MSTTLPTPLADYQADQEKLLLEMGGKWEEFFNGVFGAGINWDDFPYYPVEANSYNNFMLMTVFTVACALALFVAVSSLIAPAWAVIGLVFLTANLTLNYIVQGPEQLAYWFMDNIYKRGLYFFFTFWIKVIRLGEMGTEKLVEKATAK